MALQAIKVLPPAVGTFIQICGTRATLFLYGSMAVPENGNNGVLGLYTDDINKSLELCRNLGAKILYEPEKIENSKDNYRCFAIEDYDGNKIEIACYDK